MRAAQAVMAVLPSGGVWRAAAGFLALAALVGLAGAGPGRPGNVQGAVYAWAQAHPGEPVPVLVQTDGDPATAAAAVGNAGGAVQRQFQIVPSLQARVPGSAIDALARHPGLAWISLDAPVISTHAVDTSKLATTYALSVNANESWSKGYSGDGIGVAIVDTGVSPSGHEDFEDASGNSRVVAEVVVNPVTSNVTDGYGHGTHIAGIVGGDGSLLGGKYVGVAPSVNLINVKIADDSGAATLADVIAGLEWVYNNRAAYNIRVVNLSLHSSVAESYRTSVLDAAVEALWFNGVFVVVAAGNLGAAPDAVSYPPANDPFVMTVGAIDDMATTSYDDDVPTAWSSFGTTQDGFSKPELLTPGRGIVSVIDANSALYKTYPEKIVDKDYFRLSGTSMAAGVMSGAAALVLERHPGWRPGELKCTLIATSRALSGAYNSLSVPNAGNALSRDNPQCNSDRGLTPNAQVLSAPVVPLVGAVAHVLGAPDPPAEATAVGLEPFSALGPPGTNLTTVDWDAIKWDAIKWDAIKWDAIKWDAIRWDAIKWDAIRWDAIKWDAIKWDAIKWDAIKWDAIKWDAIKWDAIKWDAIKWDAIKWDAIKWDAIKWSAIKWDAIKWSAIKWDAIKWDAIKWDAIKWSAIKWDFVPED